MADKPPIEFRGPLEDPADVEIAVLAGEIEQLEAEMLIGPAVLAEDLRLEALEREVDDFWLEELAPPEEYMPSS